MPSSLKTTRLGLNQWVGSDKPKRNDWNSDNAILDKALVQSDIQHNQHAGQKHLHTTEEEKKKWNSAGVPHFFTYAGNGVPSRTLPLDFPVHFAIVFAKNQPLSLSTPLTTSSSGVISTYGSSYGGKIASGGITVTEQVHPLPNGYKASLNKLGVEYLCVYW